MILPLVLAVRYNITDEISSNVLQLKFTIYSFFDGEKKHLFESHFKPALSAVEHILPIHGTSLGRHNFTCTISHRSDIRRLCDNDIASVVLKMGNLLPRTG